MSETPDAVEQNVNGHFEADVRADAMVKQLDDILAEVRRGFEGELEKRETHWTKRLKLLEQRLDEFRSRYTLLKQVCDRLKAAIRRSKTKPKELTPGRSTRGGSVHDKLAERLTKRGLEVIDKRQVRGGCLWVVGGHAKLYDTMVGLKKDGIAFTFKLEGGRATGGRPGWWSKHGQRSG